MGDIAGLGLQASTGLFRVRVIELRGGNRSARPWIPVHTCLSHTDNPWIRNSIDELVLVAWLAEARGTRQPENVSGDA